MNTVRERVRARILARHAAKAQAQAEPQVPYRELQAQAKERGIAANQPRETLEAALEGGSASNE